MQTAAFWIAVGKIIWINVLLSGDNALVIAMACRGLAPRQRLWGMVIGAGIAVVLLIAFTGIVAKLMVLPYLKLVGGLALLVIAARLLVPEDEGDDVASVLGAVAVLAVGSIWRKRRQQQQHRNSGRGGPCGTMPAKGRDN